MKVDVESRLFPSAQGCGLLETMCGGMNNLELGGGETDSNFMLQAQCLILRSVPTRFISNQG